MAKNIFRRDELENILDSVIGKTLGEVDTKKVFNMTLEKPKITGIAGKVMEESVLGYKSDNKQEADLIVDGIETEFKTTGLKRTKKGKFSLEAKEPMSITAVSPTQIINEEFYNSKFWEKISHTLFVYYLYDSEKTVKASEYSNFTIQGYHFHEFNDTDTKILMNDWLVVRDFIKDLHLNYENPDKYYPNISKLRERMMYMDTAPKWPNPPRFRLKRCVLNTIVQQHFGESFEPLKSSNNFLSYFELDKKLKAITEKYKGMTIAEIAKSLSIPLNNPNKAITEHILAKMFGASNNKLRKIDTFAKMGILPKTMIQTMSGGRTEDTKFDTIDFSEWTNPNISFEESSVYNFFSEQTILFIIFKETDNQCPLEKVVFEGFKRIQFDDEFIHEKVKPTWDRVRQLIWRNELTVSKVRDRNGKIIMTPKTNLPKEETNFPKSKEYDIFLRGTGTDATSKTLTLNGYKMLPQQFWIKGKLLVELLKEKPFI